LKRTDLGPPVGSRHTADPVAMKMTASTGNLFTDLGFDDEEAGRLRLGSTLMIEVRKVIETRELTQVEAAKLLGVNQPRGSNFVRGRIDHFGIDTLVGVLARTGATMTWSSSRPTSERRSNVAERKPVKLNKAIPVYFAWAYQWYGSPRTKPNRSPC
jgi:predicted XRE-type DNA-binding protein